MADGSNFAYLLRCAPSGTAFTQKAPSQPVADEARLPLQKRGQCTTTKFERRRLEDFGTDFLKLPPAIGLSMSQTLERRL